MIIHDLVDSEAIAPFNGASMKQLQKHTQQGLSQALFGGISRSGKVSWIVRGPVIEVINVQTGERFGCWEFGVKKVDGTAYVACVSEMYPMERELPGICGKLLIAVTITGGSLLCIYNPFTSSILLAIHFPLRITSLDHLVFQSPLLLHKNLHSFMGMAVVGTVTGKVYLVDLFLDDTFSVSGEENFMTAEPISFTDESISERRSSELMKFRHLCVELYPPSHKKHRNFRFYSPDYTLLASIKSSEVFVSCLKYIKECNILVVGFNFGSFQLFNMADLTLLFSSEVQHESSPIVKLAFQLPQDDPYLCLYLWIGYGPIQTDAVQEDFTCLSMYQLGFSEVEQIEPELSILSKLTKCSLTFQHMLSSDVANKLPNISSKGSRLLSLEAIDQRMRLGSGHNISAMNMRVSKVDTTLLCAVWEATLPTSNHVTYLSIFDLNSWYNAQMPLNVRLLTGQDQCVFMSFYNLRKSCINDRSDIILTTKAIPTSFYKYKSPHMAPGTSSYYPSAYSFNIEIVLEDSAVKGSIRGLQDKQLLELSSDASLDLFMTEPLFLFRKLRFTSSLKASSIPKSDQHALVLEEVLNHSNVYFFQTLIKKLTDEEFKRIYVGSGFNLVTLCTWLWQFMINHKDSLDNYSLALFDEGPKADGNFLKVFSTQFHIFQCGYQVFCLLASIADDVQSLVDEQIKEKTYCISLLCQYYRAITWFLSVKLLPECREGVAVPSDDHFVFPTDALRGSVDRNRSSIGRLLIDSYLLENNILLESYPPSSIHEALQVFLTENCDIFHKHFVINYLLLDLIDMLRIDSSNTEFIEAIAKYPFSIGASLSFPQIKLAQAVWDVDHGRAEIGISILLTSECLKITPQWLKIAVLHSVLKQNMLPLGLRYYQVGGLAPSNYIELELCLQCLLSNNCIHEALALIDNLVCDEEDAEIWKYFFQLLCQYNLIIDVLSISLPLHQEAAIAECLMKSSNRNHQEVLVLYYLSNGRVADALKLHEHLLSQNRNEDGTQELIREVLVEKSLESQPSAFNLLLKFKDFDKFNSKFSAQSSPNPISLKVTKAKDFSPNELINIVMHHTKEVTSKRTTTNCYTPFFSAPTPGRAKPHSQRLLFNTSEDKSILDTSYNRKTLNSSYQSLLTTPEVVRPRLESLASEMEMSSSPISILKKKLKKNVLDSKETSEKTKSKGITFNIAAKSPSPKNKYAKSPHPSTIQSKLQLESPDEDEEFQSSESVEVESPDFNGYFERSERETAELFRLQNEHVHSTPAAIYPDISGFIRGSRKQQKVDQEVSFSICKHSDGSERLNDTIPDMDREIWNEREAIEVDVSYPKPKDMEIEGSSPSSKETEGSGFTPPLSPGTTLLMPGTISRSERFLMSLQPSTSTDTPPSGSKVSPPSKSNEDTSSSHAKDECPSGINAERRRQKWLQTKDVISDPVKEDSDDDAIVSSERLQNARDSFKFASPITVHHQLSKETEAASTFYFSPPMPLMSRRSLDNSPGASSVSKDAKKLSPDQAKEEEEEKSKEPITSTSSNELPSTTAPIPRRKTRSSVLQATLDEKLGSPIVVYTTPKVSTKISGIPSAKKEEIKSLTAIRKSPRLKSSAFKAKTKKK